MDSQGRKVVVCDNGTGVSCHIFYSIRPKRFANALFITIKVVRYTRKCGVTQLTVKKTKFICVEKLYISLLFYLEPLNVIFSKF